MRIGEWITGAVRDKNARFKIASAAPLPGAKPEAKSTPMQMAKKKGDEEMTELEQTEKRLSSQIEGLIGSLQTEMHELMGSLETEMHEGFDRIDANTKTHHGTGRRRCGSAGSVQEMGHVAGCPRETARCGDSGAPSPQARAFRIRKESMTEELRLSREIVKQR